MSTNNRTNWPHQKGRHISAPLLDYQDLSVHLSQHWQERSKTLEISMPAQPWKSFFSPKKTRADGIVIAIPFGRIFSLSRYFSRGSTDTSTLKINNRGSALVQWQRQRRSSSARAQMLWAESYRGPEHRLGILQRCVLIVYEFIINTPWVIS